MCKYVSCVIHVVKYSINVSSCVSTALYFIKFNKKFLLKLTSPNLMPCMKIK